VDAGQFEPAKRTIDTLNAGDRVLMIFDYDAYQAGEMDAIARAFIRHIGQRGAEVIASSLNPYGTALADRVRQKMEDEGLLMPVVVNRGYAPGQAVGAQTVLAQMAEKPASLILVLAGSPESLRWWIEQVDAAGLKTPIIAGLSAGALPQALPYIQSGQVRTAVSGLIAGLAYERDLDPEKDAERDGLNRVVQSQALYLAQLAFVLILTVGLFVSLLSRPKPSA
jgi:ABC-type sugar transport system substrate-binding protein